MTINLETRKPYRHMATTCQTRPTRRIHLRWTKIHPEAFRDGQFQVMNLSRDLVPSAAQLWQQAYPEIYGSPHEFLLDPDRYETLIALDETWDHDAAHKVYCMTVVVEMELQKVVAASLLTKFEKNLQVEFSFVATHPDYRLQDLTERLRKATRRIATDSGAEYFTTFCETWHDITQKWCLRGGWKIAGIFPGNFIRWNGDNRQYRGCTVHFYRFTADGEAHSTKPDEWRLAPEVREVWRILEHVNRSSADQEL